MCSIIKLKLPAVRKHHPTNDTIKWVYFQFNISIATLKLTNIKKSMILKFSL